MCGSAEARVTGEVDGTELSGSALPVGHAFVDGVDVSFGALGGVFLPGAEITAPDTPIEATGMLRLPDESNLAGSWFCAGPGSSIEMDADFTKSTFVARSVTALGACPGTPAAGQVDVCFSQCSDPSLQSSLDGASFDRGVTAFSAMGPVGGSVVRLRTLLSGGYGRLILEAIEIDFAATGEQTAPLSRGFLIVPQGAPDAGAIYCVGEGSTLAYTTSRAGIVPLSATLQNLSRLGSCPGTGVSGGISICTNFNE